MKYLLVFLLLFSPLTKATEELNALVGFEHISSIMNGRPFNSKPETSVDFLYVGLEYRKNDWKIEASAAQALQPSALVGSNPRAIFRIEKRINLK